MREARRILVVDDEPVVVKSCRRILADEGYEVETAGCGREGMDRALTETFDLVMTDLKMPDLDGMELVRALRRERPQTAVVIITGYGTVTSAVEATKLGVRDYIEKPFTPEDITEAAKRALGAAQPKPGLRIKQDLVKEVLKSTHGGAAAVEAPPRKAIPGLDLSPEAKAATASGEIARIEAAKLEKPDRLLMGLDLMAEYYRLGFEQQPLRFELKEFEREARQHAERLGRAGNRDVALRDMVAELRSVDDIINAHGRSENALIQILLAIQQKHHWLPKHVLMWVAERLHVPIARIYQVASFYEAFGLEPQGAHMIQVCMGTACYVRGAQKVLERISEELQIEPDQTDPKQLFTLKTVHCLGCCALGPVVRIGDEYYSDPGRKQLEEIFAACAEMER